MFQVTYNKKYTENAAKKLMDIAKQSFKSFKKGISTQNITIKRFYYC